MMKLTKLFRFFTTHILADKNMKKKFTVLFLAFCVTFFMYAQQPVLTKIGTYKCGLQPKQVLFSPDSKFIIMPLLNDNGFDVFSISEKKIVKRIVPPEASKLGFAEGLFIPQKNVFLVSQMTTAKVYEYSYPDFEHKRTISTEGKWSKFIAFCSEKQLLAVSNWISNNVTIIDYKLGVCTRMIPTAAAPRGLYFIEGGKNLICLSFDDGLLEKFEVATGKKLQSVKVEKGALRHIVLNADETKAYISDMYHRMIYEINLKSFSITAKTRVFNNPNTIKLYKDRWLFVSSRGPNNPQDYTKRSLQNGKIQIIDTNSMTVVKSFEGGNQPTGLDISPDGKYLCFSNFQDANIELYEIQN